MLSDSVTIYTDGACLGNPGPGGWAALVIEGTEEREISGRELDTTNNRMELTGAIRGLEHVEKPSKITIFTDSDYLVKGITSYIKRWRKNGWRTSTRSAVKNADLWVHLDALNHHHEVSWRWVKAHSGHPENERVDLLAREQAFTAQSEVEN